MGTNTHSSVKISFSGSESILAILACMAMMVMFIEIMLVPALPNIAMEYRENAQWVSWVLSAYLLTGAVATIVLGRMGDIYGKKKVMLFALVIYTIGLVGSAFSWSMFSLIGFRAVQGIGMGMFTLAFGLIRDTFPRRLVPVAIGMISAMFSVGVSIGLLCGGYIVSVLSWRDCFYIVIPLMISITILAWKFVKDSDIRAKADMDITGTFFLSAAILSLMLALTQGEEWGWIDGRIIGLFLITFFALAIFIWWEKKRAKTPVISLRLFKIRGILGANLGALFVGLAMFMFFQTLPFFLYTPETFGGFGISDAFTVGLYMFPSAVAQLFFAPLAGRLSRRIGADRILVGGLAIMSLGMFMLSYLHESTPEILILVFFTGIGMGFSMVSLINVIALCCPKEDFGVASGMNTLFRVIGGAIGPILATVIMASYTISYYPPNSPVPVEITNETGYFWVWIIGSVFALIGALISLILRSGKGICYDDELIATTEKSM